MRAAPSRVTRWPQQRRVRQRRAAAMTGERQPTAASSCQKPERAYSAYVSPVVAENVVAPAEEHRQLHDDEGQGRVRRAPRAGGSTRSARAGARLERQLRHRLPAHEPETERDGEHAHEHDTARGPEVGGGKRDAVRERGERSVGGDQQSGERHRDDADETDATRNGHHGGVRTRCDLGRRSQGPQRSDRGKERRAADGERAEQRSRRGGRRRRPSPRPRARRCSQARAPSRRTATGRVRNRTRAMRRARSARRRSRSRRRARRRGRPQPPRARPAALRPSRR